MLGKAGGVPSVTLRELELGAREYLQLQLLCCDIIDGLSLFAPDLEGRLHHFRVESERGRPEGVAGHTTREYEAVGDLSVICVGLCDVVGPGTVEPVKHCRVLAVGEGVGVCEDCCASRKSVLVVVLEQHAEALGVGCHELIAPVDESCDGGRVGSAVVFQLSCPQLSLLIGIEGELGDDTKVASAAAESLVKVRVGVGRRRDDAAIAQDNFVV